MALDSNLLLLLIVGFAEKTYISRHKRLRQYTDLDFDLLTELLDGSAPIITTPNTLTETSNLVVYGVAEPLRTKMLLTLRELINRSDERRRLSRDASQEPEFSSLGLADCVWLGCLDQETAFITDDLDLFNAASSRGVTAFNFTRLRQERGLLPS